MYSAEFQTWVDIHGWVPKSLQLYYCFFFTIKRVKILAPHPVLLHIGLQEVHYFKLIPNCR